MFVFIYLRKQAGRGAEEEREKESISRLPAEWKSQDPEIMTWAETKSQALNHLSHSGAPVTQFLTEPKAMRGKDNILHLPCK